MMSFELRFDAATDAAVRADWAALLDAGLPSQARHSSASNAPHFTLLAARKVDPVLRAPAPAPGEPAASLLPVATGLGGLVVFGRPPRGLVLGRLVAVSPELQALHASVHRRASGVLDLAELSAPGRWVPHVTLASRLTPAQLADAIEALDAPGASPESVMPAPGPDAAPAAASEAEEGVEPASAAVSMWHWTGSTKTLTLVEA